MECRDDARWRTGGTKQDRIDPWGLRRSGKLAERWQSLFRQELQHVQRRALRRWEQYWVDNSGGNIFFYGGLNDGMMDYWTDEIPQPSGPNLKRHLQFIKITPDKVRQFSRGGSTDGGKTWKPEYDF